MSQLPLKAAQLATCSKGHQKRNAQRASSEPFAEL